MAADLIKQLGSGKGAIGIVFALLIGYIVLINVDVRSSFVNNTEGRPDDAKDFKDVMGRRELEKIYFHRTPPPPAQAVTLERVVDVKEVNDRLLQAREDAEARARGEKPPLDEMDGVDEQDTLEKMVGDDDHVFGTHWAAEAREATERRAKEQIEFERILVRVTNVTKWWEEEYEKLRGFVVMTQHMPQAPPSPDSPPPEPEATPKQMRLDDIKARVDEFLAGAPPRPPSAPPLRPPPPPYLEETEKVSSSKGLVLSAQRLEKQWQAERPVLQRLQATLKNYKNTRDMDMHKVEALKDFAKAVDDEKEELRRRTLRLWDQLDRIFNYYEMQIRDMREAFMKAKGSMQYPTWEAERDKIQELATGNDPLLLPLLATLTSDSETRLGTLSATEKTLLELPPRGESILELLREAIKVFDKLKEAHELIGDGSRGLTKNGRALEGWLKELEEYANDLEELPSASHTTEVVLQVAHKMAEEEAAHMQLENIQGENSIFTGPEALAVRQKALDEMALKLKVLRQRGSDVQSMSHQLMRMERHVPPAKDIETSNTMCSAAKKIVRELPRKMDVVEASVNEMYRTLKLEDKSEDVIFAKVNEDGRLMGKKKRRLLRRLLDLA